MLPRRTDCWLERDMPRVLVYPASTSKRLSRFLARAQVCSSEVRPFVPATITKPPQAATIIGPGGENVGSKAFNIRDVAMAYRGAAAVLKSGCGLSKLMSIRKLDELPNMSNDTNATVDKQSPSLDATRWPGLHAASSESGLFAHINPRMDEPKWSKLTADDPTMEGKDTPSVAQVGDPLSPLESVPPHLREPSVAGVPAPCKKPTNEFLPVFTSDADGQLSRQGSFQLGSLDEKILFIVMSARFYFSIKTLPMKVAFKTEADYWRYRNARERANSKMPTSGSDIDLTNLKRERGQNSLSAMSAQRGMVRVFNHFANLSDHVEVPVANSPDSLAGEGLDVKNGAPLLFTPPTPGKPRKSLRKALAPRGFEDWRRAEEASLDKEIIVTKAAVSRVLRYRAVLRYIFAALLIFGLVVFCLPAVFTTASETSTAVREIDVRSHTEGNRLSGKNDAATKTTLIDGMECLLSAFWHPVAWSALNTCASKQSDAARVIDMDKVTNLMTKTNQMPQAKTRCATDEANALGRRLPCSTLQLRSDNVRFFRSNQGPLPLPPHHQPAGPAPTCASQRDCAEERP